MRIGSADAFFVRMQVVNDLAQFLTSLRALRAAYDACAVLPGWTRLYPAHGQMVDSRAAARAKLDEYIEHRRTRVLQVITALRAAGTGAALNVEQIVDRVYPVRTRVYIFYYFLYCIFLVYNIVYFLKFYFVFCMCIRNFFVVYIAYQF